MKNIGWFTTARGPGSFNLFTTVMDSIGRGELKARLSFLFINRDVKGNEYRTKMIRMAKENGIPVIILPSDTFRPELKKESVNAWRDAYGAEMRDRISPYEMDFGVLAGYMLILDPETCRTNMIINLHPALPDTYKGTWEEVVEKVVDNGDERYGATIHMCTPELDRGEIISFDSFDVKGLRSPTASREDIIHRVRAEEVKREAPLLIETIKMIVNEDIVLKECNVFDRSSKKGLRSRSLAEKIDKIVDGR